MYFNAGRFDSAAAALRPAIELDPVNAHYYFDLGVIAAIQGDNAEASRQLAVAETIWLDDPPTPGNLAFVTYGYGRLGRSEDAQRLFTLLQSETEDDPVNDGIWALAYMGIGEYDQALALLRTLSDRNLSADSAFFFNWFVTNILQDPMLDQPEFVEVRSRLGFRE